MAFLSTLKQPRGQLRVYRLYLLNREYKNYADQRQILKKAESYRAEIIFICIPQVCSTLGVRCMDKFKLCFSLFILFFFL